MDELDLSSLDEDLKRDFITLRTLFISDALQAIADAFSVEKDRIDQRGTLMARDIKTDLKFLNRNETQRTLKALRHLSWSTLETLHWEAFEHLGQLLKFRPKRGKP